MPKSKRNRVYALSSTRKKGYEQKSSLLQEVRDCCDKYSSVYVYGVENMRNSQLKDVRSQWKNDRFFYGKNRVMQLALGRTEAEEYKEGLHHVAEALHGNVGLLFTNKSRPEVVKWFESFSEQDFARAGLFSPEEVSLREGPLEQFSHSMEPQLRQLGLPTTLVKGVVTLIRDYTVCSAGDVLTPEQCRILKLLDMKLVEFRIVLKASWSQDGSFELLDSGPSADGDHER